MKRLGSAGWTGCKPFLSFLVLKTKPCFASNSFCGEIVHHVFMGHWAPCFKYCLFSRVKAWEKETKSWNFCREVITFYVVHRNISSLTQATLLGNLDTFSTAMLYEMPFCFHSFSYWRNGASWSSSKHWSFPLFLLLQLFFVNCKAVRKCFVFHRVLSRKLEAFCFWVLSKAFLFFYHESPSWRLVGKLHFRSFSTKASRPVETFFGYWFTRVNGTSALVLYSLTSLLATFSIIWNKLHSME